MREFTKQQRNIIYSKALQMLNEYKHHNELYYICNAIKLATCELYKRSYGSISADKIQFPELFKYRPENSSYSWFDDRDCDSREILLIACIYDTK